MGLASFGSTGLGRDLDRLTEALRWAQLAAGVDYGIISRLAAMSSQPLPTPAGADQADPAPAYIPPSAELSDHSTLGFSLPSALRRVENCGRQPWTSLQPGGDVKFFAAGALALSLALGDRIELFQGCPTFGFSADNDIAAVTYSVKAGRPDQACRCRGARRRVE